MYTVATHVLIQALGLPMLRVIPDVFVVVAAGVWLMTFAGLIVHVRREFARRGV